MCVLVQVEGLHLYTCNDLGWLMSKTNVLLAFTNLRTRCSAAYKKETNQTPIETKKAKKIETCRQFGKNII